MASRRIEDLQPHVQRMARDFLNRAALTELPWPVRILDTLRTFAEQEALYAQGRSKPGVIVTKARPGHSAHNYGLAFDTVAINAANNPWWPDLDTPKGFLFWSGLWSLAEAAGLEAFGRQHRWDPGHVQVCGFDWRACRRFWPTGWSPPSAPRRG